MVKGVSSILLHPTDELACTYSLLLLKASQMFCLELHQYHQTSSKRITFDATYNVVVIELACPRTSSSVADTPQDKQFQLDVEE